jgi:hypothetical protein
MTPLDELASVPKEMAPPPALEDRVAAALRSESLLRPQSPSWWWRAAAAIFLLAGGILIGRMTSPDAAVVPQHASASRFLFMLTDGDTSGDEAARSERYRQWAIEQQSAGRQITGERLAPTGLGVNRQGSAPIFAPEVQGYFVISAANIEDAAAVARSSPHVQSGGLIIVRPIDTP